MECTIWNHFSPFHFLVIEIYVISAYSCKYFCGNTTWFYYCKVLDPQARLSDEFRGVCGVIIVALNERLGMGASISAPAQKDTKISRFPSVFNVKEQFPEGENKFNTIISTSCFSPAVKIRHGKKTSHHPTPCTP